jgi:FtsH-binding integral membrane protein
MALWEKQSTTMQASRAVELDQGLRSYMLQVYNYMTSGLLLTGLIAYFAGTSQAFLQLMFSQGADGAVSMSPLGWLIALAPVGMVLVIGFRANAMSAKALQMTYWAYAVVMGLSLFSIFAIYTGESIARVFFVTAGTFGLLSIYGYSTKRDLTSWGSFLFVGVIAMFFTSLANVFFFKSSGLSLVMSYIGVLLALGLTAYDTQKVKEVYYTTAHGTEGRKKASILGALTLYFDFIYLFVNLIRIMGERR